jgi:hypothetical protein
MLRPLSACAVSTFVLFAAQSASAEPPSEALMKRLAVHAASFEAMRTQASYAAQGKLEQLDGDGKVSGTKEMHARVEADGTRAKFVVLSYFEDGTDKTEDAKKDAKDRAEKKDPDKEKRQIRMPFLASQKGRYVFDVAEKDKADPSRVRITFVPVTKDESTIEGSAWVDERAGTVLSAGFKVSRTSMWIDYMHIQVEFGAPTPLGPAVSKVTLDGKGGILFLRKHFRAEATLTDYKITQDAPTATTTTTTAAR